MHSEARSVPPTIVFPLEEWLGLPAEEVYPKISQGDPLHIQETCMRILRERATLLDPMRVRREATREVAFDLELCSIEDIHPNWLDNSVHRAIDRLLHRDREDEAARRPCAREDFHYLAEMFLLDPDVARRSSVGYHALPFWMRNAFVRMIIEDVQPDDAVAMGLGTRPELRHAIWSVFVAVGTVTQEEYEVYAKRFKT